MNKDDLSKLKRRLFVILDDNIDNLELFQNLWLKLTNEIEEWWNEED